jgi:hypothetical protein
MCTVNASTLADHPEFLTVDDFVLHLFDDERSTFTAPEVNAVRANLHAVGVTLTFAGTAEKDQFELLAKQQGQRNGAGFSWDFWEGVPGLSSHWVCRGCKIGRWTMTNDPATGITDKTISFISINAEKLQ